MSGKAVLLLTPDVWVEHDVQRVLDSHGTLDLLVIQIGLTPITPVDPSIPVVHSSSAETAIERWLQDAPIELPRPGMVKRREPKTWDQLAARVANGEGYEAALDALSLPRGIHPGSFVDTFRLLASGTTDGIGRHWEAVDTEGIPHVLVVVHPQHEHTLDQLQDQLEKWSGLSHPQVAPLADRGHTLDGRHWLAWRSGAKVEVDAQQALDTESLLLGVLDLADVLSAAHAADLIHGLVSPMWMQHSQRGLSLGGFGFASLSRGTNQTLLFTAPELIDPNRAATAASDLYGLGMFTLRALHQAPLPYWVLRDASRLVDQLELPTDLHQALTDALQWDPAERTTSSDALVDALLNDDVRAQRLLTRALDGKRLRRAESIASALDGRGGGKQLRDLRIRLAHLQATDPERIDAAIDTLLGAAESTESFLTIADLQARAGRPTDRIESLERAWERHRDRTEAHSVLALLVDADPERRSFWLDAWVPHLDELQAEEHILAHARTLLEGSHEQEAITWLKRLDPDLPEVAELLPQPPPTRREILEGSDDPASLFELARLTARAGEIDKAQSLYEQCLDGPHTAGALRWLAHRAQDMDDAELELSLLERLCERPESWMREHLRRAELLADLGSWRRTSDALTTILDRNPSDPRALPLALRAAFETGDLDGLAMLAERSHPMGHLSAHHAAILLWLGGREADAAALFELLIDRHPLQAGIRWGLTQVGDAPEPQHPSPHEALALVLNAMASFSTQSDPFLQAVCETDVPPLDRARKFVAALGLRGQITPDLFDVLFAHAPHWSDPLAEANTLFQDRWPAALFGRPLDAKEWLSDSIADPPTQTKIADLIEPAVLHVAIGVGVERSSFVVDDSMALNSKSCPALPGMLFVHRHQDRVYIRVDEGTLKGPESYGSELRIQPDVAITWRGVSIKLGEGPPPKDEPDVELFSITDLSESTEPRQFLNVEAEPPALDDPSSELELELATLSPDEPNHDLDVPTLDMPEPTPPPVALLRLDDGSRRGRVIPLRRSPFRLGRARECEYQIRTDGLLSRIHCTLEKFDGHWMLNDNGSSNGTLLNSQPLMMPARLRDGDRIDLGTTSFTYEAHHVEEISPEPTDESLLELEPDWDEDPVDTRRFSTKELEEARVRSAKAVLTPQEGERMVTVANAALSVLYRALDEVKGRGCGRAELQLQVDAAGSKSLLGGLSLSEAQLPVEAVVNRLAAREASERKRVLETELLEMVHRATESVCDQLPDARVEEVLALLAAVDHRRRLRAAI